MYIISSAPASFARVITIAISPLFVSGHCVTFAAEIGIRALADVCGGVGSCKATPHICSCLWHCAIVCCGHTRYCSPATAGPMLT